MIFLITNLYFNGYSNNVELRSEYLEKISIKVTDKETPYKIGDFVEVELIKNKYSIDKIIMRPKNYLKYFPNSEYSREELKDKLNKYINKISSEEFKKIIENTVYSNEDFFIYPAAKVIHHAYIGGLCEHTINLLELSDFFITKYNLDKDLMYTAIILHDYSKVKELESLGLTYSIEGNLIGHLVMVIEEITRVCLIEQIEETLRITALKHMILSHHGRLDYGSPKEPMFKEAYVLSQIDEMDAKLNLIESSLKNVEINKMSGPINAFDKRRFLNLGGTNDI